MSVVQEFSLHRQIASLRRTKGVTQEELAQAMGVSNQAVSKWESGVCCPDLQLLPLLADYFGVTTDRLLGYERPEKEENLRAGIQDLLAGLPREEVFSAAYRLAAQIHDGVFRQMDDVPWSADQPYSRKDGQVWGMSICSDPAGITLHQGGTVLLADSQFQQPNITETGKIRSTLAKLLHPNVLQVLFTLFHLTAEDFSAAVSLDELAASCCLDKDAVVAALDNLPLEYPDPEEKSRFRPAESCRHVPLLLTLLADTFSISEKLVNVLSADD